MSEKIIRELNSPIFKEKRCQSCNKKFKPTQWNQIYCGSKTNKIGCSYQMHLKRIQKFNLTINRNWMREYSKKWKREQRKKDTPYAKRQRLIKREYGKSKKGKEVANAWRRKNIKKVLLWNRKRLLIKRGVEGWHTETEWENLKNKYNYACTICGAPEKILKITWQGTTLNKLTKDHIIPIAKGGTDYIENIQPLCISCNARKKDGEVMQWSR